MGEKVMIGKLLDVPLISEPTSRVATGDIVTKTYTVSTESKPVFANLVEIAEITNATHRMGFCGNCVEYVGNVGDVRRWNLLIRFSILEVRGMRLKEGLSLSENRVLENEVPPTMHERRSFNVPCHVADGNKLTVLQIVKKIDGPSDNRIDTERTRSMEDREVWKAAFGELLRNEAAVDFFNRTLYGRGRLDN